MARGACTGCSKRHGVAHVYEEFRDDHTSVDYRMDVSLPFLAKALGRLTVGCLRGAAHCSLIRHGWRRPAAT